MPANGKDAPARLNRGVMDRGTITLEGSSFHLTCRRCRGFVVIERDETGLPEGVCYNCGGVQHAMPLDRTPRDLAEHTERSLERMGNKQRAVPA